MAYGLVKDGEVIKMSSKPTSARTSNLWLNEEAMKEEGWLPIDDKKPSLNPWQKLGSRSEEVLKTKINFTYEVIDTPLDDYKAVRLRELGSNATREILRVAPEYKQRNAALGLYSPEKVEQIKSDVQKVRTEHDTKEQLILDAVTYEDVESVYTTIVAFVPADKLDENGRIIPEDIDLV